MPSGEPLDPQVLAELRSHFEGQKSVTFDDLLALFVEQLEPRVSAIRAAIERGDGGGANAAAHVLRGSSLVVGARPLAELCWQLELAARSGAMAQAQAVMTRLEVEAARVRRALEEAMQRKTRG
jgi:HPt (histidine-containing phosphotransfer) domain-containing protein